MATVENSTLVALIELIVLREQSALSSLYGCTRLRVYLTADRVLHSKHDAEEIVGDVFRFVWENTHKYEHERGGVMGWLTVITRGRAIDLVRKRRRDLSFDDGRPRVSATSPIADVESAYDAFAQGQDTDALHAALAVLSPLRRRLVGLAFFQGLTHEDIVGLVGLPAGTVKSHIRRALIDMRTALNSIAGPCARQLTAPITSRIPCRVRSPYQVFGR